MNIAVIGDVHGHLAVMYAVLGRWQRESGRRIDLILQVGDLGTFLPTSRLDQATKRFSERDPDELGFREFAGPAPAPATLLDPRPLLVYIPGNHEDFEYLEQRARLAPDSEPIYPVSEDQRIQALRSGRVFSFSMDGESVRVAGVAGVAKRASKKGRHPWYHINDDDALRLASGGAGRIDILISHDCPEGLWNRLGEPAGSPALRLLIEETRPRYAFFGHYDRAEEWAIGPTRIIGMGDCGYESAGNWPLRLDGVAIVEWGGGASRVERICPGWLKQSTRQTWRRWGVL